MTGWNLGTRDARGLYEKLGFEVVADPRRFMRLSRAEPDQAEGRPAASGSALTSASSCNIYSFMKRDSRLSGILHVLLHMAEEEGPITSEQLAKAMRTNPVVIRRIMAGLRHDGIVRSEKGHGGGWTIARDLSTVTLREIYEALGSPDLFAMGNRTETPACLVEQAVNAAMDDAFARAEALLLDRLGEVTLAALGADFRARMHERAGHCEFDEQNHAA